MKTTLHVLMIALTAGFACAQGLAPELAPLAAKYESDLAALETQRAAAVAQAQKSYLTALGASERNAGTAGDVASVAAIATERAAISSGLMAPGFPAGLPKALQRDRRTYLDAIARIRTAEAPRRQALDAAYLRALTNLESKAKNNAELATQLASEKQNLLANAPGRSGDGKPSSKSAVINGTFDIADAEGRPGGWTTSDLFKVARDGTNYVVHAAASQPGYQAITQDIVLPSKARNVTLSGRVRGKVAARDPNQAHFGAFVGAVFVDEKDQQTDVWMMLDGGNDAEWKSLTGTEKIPDRSKVLRVFLILKYVAGEFDYDDVAVEFR